MLQRFNSVLLHDTVPVDLPDLWPSDILILAFVVFNPVHESRPFDLPVNPNPDSLRIWI